jgi:excisionase family DNA binding protein
MSAYATAQIGRSCLHTAFGASRASLEAGTRAAGRRQPAPLGEASGTEAWLLDALLETLASLVAVAVIEQLGRQSTNDSGEWLDSRSAAEYLGVHRDTLRKLAGERAIPVHQDGRGCKLFFRRSDLDEWRERGGREVHLDSLLARAA